MAFLRTIGDMTLEKTQLAFGILKFSTWENIYTYSSSFGTTYLLGMAMAGVGLSTNFKMFKGIGIKPFIIGFIAAITIGIISITLISIFGRFITL